MRRTVSLAVAGNSARKEARIRWNDRILFFLRLMGFDGDGGGGVVGFAEPLKVAACGSMMLCIW